MIQHFDNNGYVAQATIYTANPMPLYKLLTVDNPVVTYHKDSVVIDYEAQDEWIPERELTYKIIFKPGVK